MGKLKYCKSTKFGVLLSLAFLALGQKLNRIIYEKTSIIIQKVANPPNFIAAKYGVLPVQFQLYELI